MGQFDHLFQKMQHAKPLSQFAERLGIGEHVLLLKRFAVKISDKDKTPIVESDFLVVESNVHPKGETRGWPWFVGKPGFAGSYEEARCTDFIKTVGECTGDARTPGEIGSDLYLESQPYRGLMIGVAITRGKPNKNVPGEFYTVANWVVLQPGQTADSCAANCAQIDAADKLAAAAAGAVAKPAPAAAPAAPAQPAPGGFGRAAAAPAPAPGGFGQAAAPAPAGSILGGFRRS
jgi:hypothetical protein